MKSFIAAVTVALIFASTAAMAAAKSRGTIVVVYGQTRVINTPDVKRVAVGNGALVEVKTFRDTNQVLLIGKKPGVTDMRVWGSQGRQTHYQIKVVSGRPKISLSDVKAILEGMRGIRASELSNGNILIAGAANRSEDAALVAGLAKRYSSVIDDVTKPKVSMKATILVNARVLEVQRSTMKNLGIDWSTALNGPTFGLISDWLTNSLVRPVVSNGLGTNLPLDAGTKTYLGINTRLDSVINIMAQSNVARTLAEPRVSVVSGQKAKFLVGGEVPIPVINGNGSTNVQYKKYGIILNIQPVADRNGFINTKVDVEVSSIDPTVNVQGVPGFRTRRTETDMNVRDGQTLVISGLLSSKDSKEINKVPGLGDIPILGELFKSRQFQRQRTELVVMVTPELTSPASPQNQEQIRHERELAQDSLKATHFHIFN